MQFYNVKSVEETIKIIQKEVDEIQDHVIIPLTEARGNILAKDVKSGESVPGFTRSTVNGYAVIAKEIYGSSESMPAFLQVIGEDIKQGEVLLQKGARLRAQEIGVQNLFLGE